jgi:hypothetical protein
VSSEPTDSLLGEQVPTCPPTRRSARAKNVLMYDQKYHPMDDYIRPSQAAKRRSLHGEKTALPDNSSASFDSVSDVGSMVGDGDSDDEDSQPPTRGRKRKRKRRTRSRTPEPTRRSSRRRTNPKVSYDMKIHPQDSDLARVYACDGSTSSPLPNKRGGSSTEDPPKKSVSFKASNDACRDLPADALRGEQ